MDLLDPMDGSSDHDEEDQTTGKVIIHASSGMSMDEQSVCSDDVDDPQVDPLSPQTLLETPHEDVQYSFRTAEGISTVTYGVLKVEDENGPQLLSTPNFSNATVPQVITSNLNGHLYVIGPPSDVFLSQQAGVPRTIAPRAAEVESGATSTVHNIKKAKRDERRRATHNEVERRRRDKINNWITKLASIIPFSNENKGNSGHYDGQSKGGILAKACDYITELRDCAQKLEEKEAENKRVTEYLDVTKKKNLLLEKENKLLREVLKQHGIEVTSTHVTSNS